MSFQTYLSHWRRPQYLWKKAAILLLCVIHSFTRDHVFRSVLELFLWRDGLCADMIVVTLFLTVCIMSLADDMKILYESIKEDLG